MLGWKDMEGLSCEESSRHVKDLELSVTWEPQKDVERSDLHLAACWETEEERGGIVKPRDWGLEVAAEIRGLRGVSQSLQEEEGHL